MAEAGAVRILKLRLEAPPCTCTLGAPAVPEGKPFEALTLRAPGPTPTEVSFGLR